MGPKLDSALAARLVDPLAAGDAWREGWVLQRFTASADGQALTYVFAQPDVDPGALTILVRRRDDHRPAYARTAGFDIAFQAPPGTSLDAASAALLDAFVALVRGNDADADSQAARAMLLDAQRSTPG